MESRTGQHSRRRLYIGIVTIVAFGFGLLFVVGVALEGESGALFGALFEGGSTAGSSDDSAGGEGADAAASAGGKAPKRGPAGSNDAGEKDPGATGSELLAGRVGSGDTLPIQGVGIGLGLPLGVAPGAAPGAMVEVDGEDAESKAFAAELVTYQGRVLDALTGRGLVGVEVQVSFFRGDVDFAHAGVPALRVLSFETNGDGSFTFPALAPEDPSLRVRIQAQAMDRAPVVCVLHDRDGVRGVWDEVETTRGAPDSVWLLGRSLATPEVQELTLYMRYVETTPVRVVDRHRRPLSLFPVRVRGRVDSHALLDEPEVEVARNGRYVRPDEWRVMYTDESGTLFLPFSDYAYDFESLHPDFYLHERDALTEGESFGKLTFELSYTEELLVTARSEWRERHRVVDSEQNPIAIAAVEVQLEGMIPIRVLTDEEGWFQLGIQPYPRDEPPLGFQRPREGRLTVLGSRFQNRSVDVAFPSARADVEIPGRASPRLRFRCVAAEEGDDGLNRAADREYIPLPARAFRSSLRMTTVRAGADGIVELEGKLPDPNEDFGVVLSGYLPVVVRMPDRGPRVVDVDLGDIPFERGWTKTVEVRGVEKEALRSARLFVTCIDEELQDFVDLETHRYEVDLDGKVLVGGLRRGGYLLGVEGSTIESASANRQVFQEDLDKPFTIEASVDAEETVVVSGNVPGLEPEEADRMQVIERFVVRGKIGTMTMPAYPLSTDGNFGSVRRLAGVESVHVSILSEREKVAQATLRRDQAPDFRFGDLRLGRRPYADVTFVANGLGEVLPPWNVSLERNDGLETVARFRYWDDRLRIDNLHHGQYVLRWRSDRVRPGRKGRDESFLLNVRNVFGGGVEATVERSRALIERVKIRVVDVSGDPVVGFGIVSSEGKAFASVSGLRMRRESELEPGEAFVEVSADAPTVFKISKVGFLDTKVRVGPQEEFPREYVLFPEDHRIRGELIDVDGQPFEGLVEISWKPLSESAVTYGRPVLVDVRNGRFQAGSLPGLPRKFTFRPKDSSDSVTRTFTVPLDREPFDVGKLRLGQTRVLRGIVLLPDGSPAKGATVMVLPQGQAYRFPMREPVDLSRVSHRTKTNVQGDFELDGLPRELPTDWTLVARLDGWNDSVQDPIETEAESHRFVLGAETILGIRVGYEAEFDSRRYRFDLEYQRDPADPETRVSLGEIPADLYGRREYVAVPPGSYRVTWGLRDAYEPIAPVWEDVFVPDGGEAQLSLFIEGVVLRGTARLNGKSLGKGWILLTHDPGVNGGTRVGRIEGGQFEIVDAPDSRQAWAAIIPERSPQPTQNIVLGSALPVAVPGYRSAFRSGVLSFDYEAFDLTIEIAGDLLSRNPDSRLFFDANFWEGRGFVPRETSMPIESSTLTFFLMQPRTYRFKIRNKRGSLLRSFGAGVRDRDEKLIVR